MSQSTSRMASTSTTAAPSSVAIALAARRIDVADGQARAGLHELARQVRADVADALNGDVQPLQVRLAEDVIGDRLDAATAAERGKRRRIARSALFNRGAEDVLGGGAHDVHVRRRRSRVFGRDVAAAEVVDEAAERAEERGALVGGPLAEIRRRHDDRLAAAVREARDRGLVGHSLRQARDVVDGVRFRLVVADARAADGRPEPRRVDAHQRAQPRGGVVSEMQLAVAQLGKGLENVH